MLSHSLDTPIEEDASPGEREGNPRREGERGASKGEKGGIG